MMATGYVRCDDEFSEIDEDLDMSNFGTVNVKEVIFNGNKTIVIWADGTKTIVGCGEGDSYDPYAGFCAAVVKYVFGSTGEAKQILKMTSKIQSIRKKSNHVDKEDT